MGPHPLCEAETQRILKKRRDGKMVHCWETDEEGSFCMLKLGHPGKHDWTPESEVEITFLEQEGKYEYALLET